jgi:hypothetical protein
MFNSRSFTHRNQTPLTIDEIGRRAPSALATRPFDGMSTKYCHIATLGVIEAMIAAGFQPFSATQSRTRVPGKGDFTKHMLRFRHGDVSRALAVGDVLPEVVLINSHDGTSAYKLIAGLYRLICSNGLMVSDREIDSISVTHKGDVLKNVVESSHRLIGDTQRSLMTVQKWTQLQLTDGEQKAFAESAHAVRFADADGKVTTPITPAQLLAPRRHNDEGNDLWRTFNRVQENVTAGGLSAVLRDANGRRIRQVSTRRISGIDADVRLNRALWELAAKMAELKKPPQRSEAPFAQAEVVA